MGYEYPIVLILGMIVLAVIFLVSFIIRPGKRQFKSGRKIANTKFIKSTSYYRTLAFFYKAGLVSIKVFCLLSIGAGVIMLAMPFEYKVSKQSLENKDIFLCMDVSTSVDELNDNLIKQFLDDEWTMEGEQFGITIFNTSSTVLVPLTSDYDYVNSTFEDIEKGFDARANLSVWDVFSMTNEDLYYYDYLSAGTLTGNETRGSSLIGDGLASCLYDFEDNSDKSKTQIVILTTDNYPQGEELVTITQAADIAVEKGIRVYGICPTTSDGEVNPQENIDAMKAAVEKTGGSFYIASSGDSVKKVMDDIQELESSKMEKTQNYKEIEIFVPFILMLIGICGMTVVRKLVQG